MSEETIIKRVFGPIAGVPNPISDWDETNERSTKFIKNKPDLNALTSYNNSEPLINDIGGIKASEHANGFNNVQISDLLTELLYPYTEPVIDSVTLNPATGTYKIYEELIVNSVKASVSKKSKVISKVELWCGPTGVTPVLVDTFTGDILSSGTLIDFNASSYSYWMYESSVTYTVKVYEEGKDAAVAEKSATYTFVYPYYYGVVNKDDEVNDLSGLTEDVKSKGSKTYEYTTTSNQCPVIAYPASYGEIKTIKDANNFSQTWNKHTITYNGVDYFVYVGGAAEATKFKYTFSY